MGLVSLINSYLTTTTRLVPLSSFRSLTVHTAKQSKTALEMRLNKKGIHTLPRIVMQDVLIYS